MFFSLDAGLPRDRRAHADRGIAEPRRALATTLVGVIVPNIRVAALGGSFLTLAIVMGEFTIANLAAFHTFPIYIQYINETKAYPAGGVSLISFGITWAAMLVAARWSAAAARGRVHMGRGALMAFLELRTCIGLRRSRARRDRPRARPRGVPLAARTLAVRQDDGASPRCRLRPPDAGWIVVDGKDITRVPPNRRDMGMVFQAYSLFPNMTARAERRVRAEDPRPREGGPGDSASASCSSSSASDTPATAIPISSPAGCSSGSRSRARSRSSRACCSSTSRSRRSTRRCACSCGRRSGASRRARDHDPLRHARPGGGAVGLRPRRGDVSGRIEQIGTPAEIYGRPPRRSWPSSSAR